MKITKTIGLCASAKAKIFFDASSAFEVSTEELDRQLELRAAVIDLIVVF